MLKHILKIIIVFEAAGLCYYLLKIAALVFAEYNSAKSYKKVQETSYQKTLENKKIVDIIKNLKEAPYVG